MVVANLTRDSVRAALARGITAEQVWTYSTRITISDVAFVPRTFLSELHCTPVYFNTYK